MLSLHSMLLCLSSTQGNHAHRLSAVVVREGGGGGGGGGAAAARSVGAALGGGGAADSSKWASVLDGPAAGPATGRTFAQRRQWVDGSDSELRRMCTCSRGMCAMCRGCQRPAEVM
jgi:hypothetical protein